MKKRVALFMAIVMIANIVLGSYPTIADAIGNSNNQNSQSLEQIEKEQKKESKSSIKLNKSKLFLDIGEKYKLKYIVEGNYDKDNKLEWTSSDNSILTVDEGEICSLKEGLAIVKIKSTDGKLESECKVTVSRSSIVKDMAVENTINDEYSFILQANKNYEIRNNSSEQWIYIGTDSDENKTFDIVEYDEYGNAIDYYKNEYGHIWIRPNQKIKISNHGSNDITCNLNINDSEFINVEEVESPALYEIKFTNNKSYEIVNKTESEILIDKNNDISYDIVEYSQEGYQDGYYKSTTDDIYLNGLENIRVSFNDNDSEEIVAYIAYDDYEKIQIKESDIPALYKFNISTHKNYEIANIGQDYISYSDEWKSD